MARKQKISDPRTRGRRQQPVEETAIGALSGQQMAYDLEEDTTGISLGSMKKAAKYMWLSIVFMILCIGSIFGYFFLYNATIVSAQTNCWLEQQNIENLANKYIVDNGFASLPAYVEDIPGYEQLYRDCPSGGGYTWNPVLGQFSCSEHEHYPEGFNKAQSQVQGTSTKVIPANEAS